MNLKIHMILLVPAVMLFSIPAASQDSTEVRKTVFGSGGAISVSNSDYIIGGTIGEPVQSTIINSDNGLLIIGFWHPDTISVDVVDTTSSVGNVYLPASSEISIYPNPAIESTILSFTISHQQAEAIGIGVFSLAGEKVYSSKHIVTQLGKQRVILPTVQFTPGMYFVRLSTANEQVVVRFMYIRN